METMTITMNSHQLKEHATRENSTLLFDSENKIVAVRWSGKVKKETAAYLLGIGASLVESDSATKILLNRADLEEFPKDTREWIRQDLLKNTGRRLAHKVEKVATIKSNTEMGSLYSNVISSAIKIMFPRLKVVHFDDERSALDWFLSE